MADKTIFIYNPRTTLEAYQKILLEREILLQVALGFNNVSFLHEVGGDKTADAIKAKSGKIQLLSDLIAETENRTGNSQRHDEDKVKWEKELLGNQAALPIMKQIKKWVDQL